MKKINYKYKKSYLQKYKPILNMLNILVLIGLLSNERLYTKYIIKILK